MERSIYLSVSNRNAATYAALRMLSTFVFEILSVL